MWPIEKTTKRMLEVTEMDFWRRVAERSRLERVINERIKDFVQETRTIADEINRQLTRYGHVQRMHETWIPKRVTNWKPPGRRKSGRPRRIRQESINKIMQERTWEISHRKICYVTNRLHYCYTNRKWLK